jgi:hypothetical protein
VKKVSTVIVTDFTNWNTTNYNFSHKSIIHKKKTYGIGNAGHDLGQAQKCGMVKSITGNEIQHSPSYN